MAFDDEIDDRRRHVALFRQAVIGEVEAPELERGEISARIAELAERTFEPPWGGERRFSERTLWSWWGAYKKGGLVGLVPCSREQGPREVTPEVLEAAVKMRTTEGPWRSTSTVIDVLEKQGLVGPGKLKRSTLDRHLCAAGASRRRLKTLGDKRFTRLLFEHPNDFWVGDYHEAPILWVPEHQRYRTIHLCAYIDHYSKLVPHAQWYSNEQIATLEDTTKKSTLKRGCPTKVYVDRGAVYRSDAFAFALGLLDIRLVRSKAYAKEARGAIERFNRTVAEGFEPEVRAAQVSELERINLFWEAWLEERYHLVPHGTTGERPLDRYAQEGFVPRYPDPVLVADIFRVRVRRKVHPKTITVEALGRFFSCESFLRGRWVTVYFDPFALDDVLVFLKGKRVQRAFPQKVNDPQPTPERPVAAPLSFDYLGALRAQYDRRIVEQARHISFRELTPSGDFTLPSFLALCAEMLGKQLAPYERDELVAAFHGVGPFSEKTVRLALEHALKLRGRGLHVAVYSHYLKVFQLAAIKANKE
jgi:transposase InsO family protein